MSRRRRAQAARQRRQDATLNLADPNLSQTPSSLSPVVDLVRNIGLESINTRFREVRRLTEGEVDGLYQDGIARACNDLPIDGALSGWPRLWVEEEWREKAKQVERLAEELDLPSRYTFAAKMAQKDGWAAFAAGYSDAADDRRVHSQPAPWGYARILWLRDLRKWDCQVTAVYGPASEHMGQARCIYNSRIRPDVEDDPVFLPGLGEIHGERFVRLATPNGRSNYETIAGHLANLLAGTSGIGSLLSRASIGVYKIGNWEQKVRRDPSTAYAVVNAQHQALSTLNALVLDKDNETFEQLSQGALGGSENAVYALSWMLAAAARIPMTRLYGLPPSGFSDGSVSEREWHDRLNAERAYHLPRIRAVYDWLWCEVLGVAAVPPYELEWPALVTPTPEETAGLVVSLSTAAKTAIESGIADPSEIAAGLNATPGADLWKWGRPEPPAPEGIDAPGPVPAPAPAAPPPVPEPEVVGTWLEAGPCSERSGVSANRIKSLGSRGAIHRRKIGSRWEFLLEDVLRIAAESIEGPSSVAADEAGPEADEDPDEYIARAYRAFHETVNMSASEMREWRETECSSAASLNRDPIDRNIRLLETPREKWTVATARSAMRTVSFVARMRGAENGEPVCGDYSKREISLKNWAFNPRA